MTDGNIIAAVEQLRHAIHNFIDRQPKTLTRDTGRMELTYIPSRYQHLQDSLGGQQVEAKSGGQARLPVWADAIDLARDIDTTTATWLPLPNVKCSTPDRLTAIENTTWRPQDTQKITDWTTQINTWSTAIDRLLNPETIKEVLAPCPACGQRYVHRLSAGERIRTAALQVTGSNGTCHCLACQAEWPPLFLLRLIGGDMPEGILE